MFTNKFEYQPISRVVINGKRHYATPDGNKLPSVTTILDKTKPQETIIALNRWRDRVGHAKAQEITTEAAGVGTVMHKMLEEHCKGVSKPPGSNQVQQVAHNMAQSIINNGLHHITEFWGLEVPLYFPGLYAGTTDLACCWKGMPAIGDFKQTNKPKKREYIDDYFLQLVFYGSAHNELYGTDINTGVIMMCSRDGQYQEFVISGEEWNKYESLMCDRIEQYYNQIAK